MREIVNLKTPVEAKRYGKTNPAIKDHLEDSYKLMIMQKVVDLKYEIPLFKAFLLSTKDEELVHDVLHHDTFFGRVDGIGKNHLGMMLMDKREDLRGKILYDPYYTIQERLNDSTLKNDKLREIKPLDPNKATLRIAGIGSRDLPEKIGIQIDSLMEELNTITGNKLIVHTGDADGSDLRFKANAKKCLSYLPFKGFNGSTSELYEVYNKAKILASFHHPYFDKMKPNTQKLMGRNVYQVISDTYDNWVDCVICYTSDGVEKAEDVKVGVTGGTGLAIALADRLGIPVFNLKNEDAVSRILSFYSVYKDKYLNEKESDWNV